MPNVNDGFDWNGDPKIKEEDSDKLRNLHGFDDKMEKGQKFTKFNKKDLRGTLKPTAIIKFRDHKLFRKVLKEYSIHISFDYDYLRNDFDKIIVVCQKGVIRDYIFCICKKECSKD